MFKNLSSQNKSFIILAIIAAVGTYVAIVIGHFSPPPTRTSSLTPNNSTDSGAVASANDHFMPEFKPVDTSNWKTYSDPKYPLSFNYDPAWTVKPGKIQDGFYVLEIDPGAKYYNMKVYVSTSQFYNIDGLPFVKTDINGAQAYNVSNLLYGIKMGPNYYTFENGLSTNMIDNFNALVRTVTFQ